MIVLKNKYEKAKSDIRVRIREGKIGVLEANAENHACFFCKKHIDGKMKVLIIQEETGESKVYSDEKCYRQAFFLTEYRNLLFSIN